MKNLSIVTRIVILCAFLLAVLIASNLYLNRALSNGSQTLLEEAKVVSTMTTASAATRAFGDLKYWLTDLAASLLIRSELEAEEARERLNDALDKLELQKPDEVKEIRHEVEEMVERSLSAVDAYTDEQRVMGNTLMSSARTHIAKVDGLFAQLVRDLEAQVQERSEQTIQSARSTERNSICLLYTSPSPRDS